MKRDPDLEAWLVERLAHVVIQPFETITEPETRIFDQRPTVIRPSSLASCERRLTIEELKYQSTDGPWTRIIPAALATKLNFGTHIHRIIQSALPELAHEVPVSSKSVHGTLDTFVASLDMVLDYKTAEARTVSSVVKAGKPRDDHSRQVNWYGVAAGAAKQAIVYILKDSETETTFDDKHIVVFSGTVDAELAGQWNDKANRIRDHAKAGTYPPYAEITECRWCPVRQECWLARPDEELRTMGSKIVGTTFRSDDERAAIELLEPGQLLGLQWEPGNQWDLEAGRVLPGTRSAVAVKVMWGSAHLGYLPADGAAIPVARHFSLGGIAECEVKGLTGKTQGKESRGVNLLIRLA